MIAKECHQAVSKYHATVETNLIRKNNVGSFYNYVNRKLGTKSVVASSVKKSDGSLTNDDNEKAEIFNNFLLEFSQMTTGNSLLLTLVWKELPIWKIYFSHPVQLRGLYRT